MLSPTVAAMKSRHSSPLGGKKPKKVDKKSSASESPVLFHDLDDLIGSWREDPEFEAALELQDQIDSNSCL
ncbi:MAG TPA: hypothetical protein DF383_12575 [Deltaproteobacteria bacterium]|nr:hypothetical protein [Deltaproteobacteria bacterium]